MRKIVFRASTSRRVRDVMHAARRARPRCRRIIPSLTRIPRLGRNSGIILPRIGGALVALHAYLSVYYLDSHVHACNVNTRDLCNAKCILGKYLCDSLRVWQSEAQRVVLFAEPSSSTRRQRQKAPRQGNSTIFHIDNSRRRDGAAPNRAR